MTTTKKEIKVKSWKVTEEYVRGLIDIPRSEEFREILEDAARGEKDVIDDQYMLGAQCGFLLAISMTHQIDEEI